ADIEELEIEPARLRLRENAGGKMKCLNVVLRIGALAADVEAESFDHKLVVVREGDKVDRLAGQRPKLAGKLDHRSGVGHAQAQHQARVRGVPGDLLHLLVIVIGHERFVWIELLERLDGLDRVGVDDAVPNEILALFGWQLLDAIMHGHELSYTGDIETAARI